MLSSLKSPAAPPVRWVLLPYFGGCGRTFPQSYFLLKSPTEHIHECTFLYGSHSQFVGIKEFCILCNILKTLNQRHFKFQRRVCLLPYRDHGSPDLLHTTSPFWETSKDTLNTLTLVISFWMTAACFAKRHIN